MEGMNTRHLGIRFRPGLDRKSLDRKTGELLAEIASSSQRISAPDGAKKFSVRPRLSGESLSHSRGALQAMIGESLAGSAVRQAKLARSSRWKSGTGKGVASCLLASVAWSSVTAGAKRTQQSRGLGY